MGSPDSIASPPLAAWCARLFERTALGVILLDRQRRIIDCNEGFCRLVGRRRDELLGHATQELVAPQDEDVGALAMAELLAGAFENREQASGYAESLRASGITPVLVYRKGRTF